MLTIHTSQLTTPFGPLGWAATETGLVRVWFGTVDEMCTVFSRDGGAVKWLAAGSYVSAARAQIEEYLQGERQTFDIALDWRGINRFRRRVLQELAAVPYGVTVTYGELARRAGRPDATRAVGGIMASNPLPVVVPCHRVIRRGGALGGFAGARDAVETKQWLLAHEGAVLV